MRSQKKGEAEAVRPSSIWCTRSRSKVKSYFLTHVNSSFVVPGAFCLGMLKRFCSLGDHYLISQSGTLMCRELRCKVKSRNQKISKGWWQVSVDLVLTASRTEFLEEPNNSLVGYWLTLIIIINWLILPIAKRTTKMWLCSEKILWFTKGETETYPGKAVLSFSF